MDNSNLSENSDDDCGGDDSKFLRPPPPPPEVEDASGRILRPGSVVKTLSLSFVKKSLPSQATEAQASRLADQRAIVHDITGDKLYVEIAGGNIVSLISASAVVLESEGQKIILSDGTEATTGSFVQIMGAGDVTAGHGPEGWIPDKKETCGRTGRVVRISKDNDVLVQFAWGPSFYYQPIALLQSSQEKVETKDCSKKSRWLKSGSIVQVSSSQEEFLKSQRKNHLPAEPAHASLLGRYVIIKKIFIKAFSTSKPVAVTTSKTSRVTYIVNSEVLKLAQTSEDREGSKLRIGDKVKVMGNIKEVKSLQLPQYGGWEARMENYLGIVGQIVKFGMVNNNQQQQQDDLNLGEEVEGFLGVKVKFYDGLAYYFNPNAVTLHQKYGTVMDDADGDGDDDDNMGGTLKPSQDTIKNPDVVGLSTPSAASTLTSLEMIEGEDLDCFEILGEGSFGCVVRGTWRQKDGTRIRVAIKKIKLGNVKAEAVLKEANIQFSLSHPNIVKLYGMHEVSSAGTMNRELWMVMNLVDGNDLFNLIFKDPQPYNRMTFDRKVKLCSEMSSAIAYIHHRRYLHCDIKPHNMMIDRNSGTLFVCDFGITRFLGDMDTFMTRVTQYTGGISGTLAYIPPECFQQDPVTDKYKRPTAASDIWALGVVFYELFAERLFCESWLKLLQNIATNNTDFVKKQIVNVSEKVRPMVLRTLNFNPKVRPSAQELNEYFNKF